MAAQLHLVSHCGADLPAATPPRVLSRDTLDRLITLNAAVRALRDMGLQVLEQHLRGEFPARGEPTVHINRDPAQSIAPLLDAAGPRRWMPRRHDGAVATAFAPFRGVIVIWEERV
ncbi:hypothetical protein [Aromatoleum evansii]|uniref:hypothetical protein n=1 Tax=Aromatoleum evansii TaxID=59406 RepID=UPI00145CAB63|nr:hypothetical protein [Aromatoleum evansii]NMG29329.1 hypothetical protein [Aromatoleum evansii]